ncbi:MAG: leukotriene A4 hydrolase C-terminal domain-containing protein, partial [Pseudomonadota bacterium]
LAHSWSGNLVTNAVWSDLWLNEGFTVYLEALIMEAVYGEDRRRMEDVLGYRSLLEEFETLPPGDQLLAANLAGRDPDDAFSNVAYEKGRLFIIWLESRIGREPMAVFLREYFEQFAFQSITTPRFETYALEKLGEAGLTQDDLDRWLREPGLPEDAVLPTSDAFERIDAVAAEWLAGDRAPEAVPFGEWSVHEQLYFLSLVPESIDGEVLAALDAAHGLTGAANAEVAHRWYRIAIAQRYEPAFAALTAYLEEIGRIKLVRPLYEALFVSDWGAPMASEIYARARAGYHPLTQSTIDALVP